MRVIKITFGMAVLLFLILMGVHNAALVDFHFPPFGNGQQPAAVMYFVFFATGVFTGAVLTLRRPKASTPEKPFSSRPGAQS